MLVPKYWAKARLQYKSPAGVKPKRQITLRRLGWSDISEEDAQQLAEQRAQEAMQDILSGKIEEADIQRFERQFAYNGADGIPIREEIITKDDHGNVITRNAYGALCLNTPDVMFIDIDLQPPRRYKLYRFVFRALWLAVTLGLCAYLSPFAKPDLWYVISMLCAAVALGGVGAVFLSLFLIALLPDPGKNEAKLRSKALAEIDQLEQTFPAWTFNLYETKAGYRLLVLNDTFDPQDKDLWSRLESTSLDHTYMMMCRLQNCFRARLSPKPWRIGLHTHIEPKKKAWELEFSQLPQRLDWIAKYENAAQGYATCRFLKCYGNGFIHPKAEQVRILHDDYTKAYSDLPLA